MLKKLDEKQNKLISQVREEWINICIGGETSIDKESAKNGIRWIYNLAGLKSPIIIFIQSPMECQIAAHFLMTIFKKDNKINQKNIKNEKIKFLEYSYDTLAWNSYWVSFYDYFKRLGIVNNKEFDSYMNYLKSGVFMGIFLKNAAIVCPRPAYIKKDMQKRLHSNDSPAMEWDNGEKYWLWHGIRVTEKIIMRPQEITREDILNEKNSEVSRAIAEKIGWDCYMKLLDVYLVNQWFDPSVKLHYELYDFKERKFELMPRLLKMESPELNDGTRPFYIEPVDPGLKTCQAARAWQFMKIDGSWPSVEEANENPEIKFEVEC